MRIALRTAVATALLAGLAMTPVVATGTALAADGPAATAEDGGTLVRTVTLADGTVVKVYKLGPTHYRADAFLHGRSIGSIEANGRPAAANNNGHFAVLTEDGRIISWQGNYAHPTKSGTYRLADGTLVQIDLRSDRTGIQLIAGDKGLGWSYVNDKDFRKVFYMGKDAVVVLEYRSGLSAYIAGPGKKQGVPEYLGPGIVTPKPTTPAPLPPAKTLSGPTVTAICTVKEEIESSFGAGWVVSLTNDLNEGPSAVLRKRGSAVATVDRAHPVDSVNGLKIERADTLTPRFGQRTQGGDMPYRWNDFPKLPKGCVKTAPSQKPTTSPSPTPSATPSASTGTGTGTGTGTQGGQTSVVPKGGVAAGAEFGSVEQGNDTALLASGAGAAVVVAGLGLTALRRRSAARG
ncbi:hypothetical protein [Streptomyces sp. NPDC126499]|uniref:hypothetical protein n=1 Tax=Streptomyces sp. NPDC126499 TaxID=3155314 RepID=UPI0033227669